MEDKRKPLTKAQKGMLATIAKRAWDLLNRSGVTDESFDDWRLRHARRICGVRISEAKWDMFDDLFIHFKAEAGDVDEAYRRAVEGVGNQKKQVLWLIKKELEKVGFTYGYALKIARDKWGEKLGLQFDLIETLPLHAMRTVLFDVKRAVRAAVKRRAAGAM
jgi:hypothetical protein